MPLKRSGLDQKLNKAMTESYNKNTSRMIIYFRQVSQLVFSTSSLGMDLQLVPPSQNT